MIRRRPGLLLALYLILYPLGRFANEFLRGDYESRCWGLTNGQIVSLLLLPAGIILFWWLRRRPAEPTRATTR